MNMMSVLLGATGLLLVAALILSMGSMNSDSNSDEVAKLRAELHALQEADRDLLSRRGPTIPDVPPTTPNPAPAAVAEAARQADDAAKIKALQDKVAEQAQRDTIRDQEEDLLTEEARARVSKSARRAKNINNALLVATVIEYSAEIGFAVVNIQRHDNSQVGTELAIRRNSGIVGHVKVAQLYPDSQAAVDPLPGTFFGGPIDIRPGDELIVPPL